MREVQPPKGCETILEYFNQFPSDATTVDWKAGVDEVLIAVDRQLAARGLEVVFLDDDTDQYTWWIEKRVKRFRTWIDDEGQLRTLGHYMTLEKAQERCASLANDLTWSFREGVRSGIHKTTSNFWYAESAEKGLRFGIEEKDAVKP